MSATLAQLISQLDRLQASLTSALSVQHGDERVQFRSIDEIRSAIAAVEQQIATAGGQAVVRSFKLTTCKDL